MSCWVDSLTVEQRRINHKGAHHQNVPYFSKCAFQLIFRSVFLLISHVCLQFKLLKKQSVYVSNRFHIVAAYVCLWRRLLVLEDDAFYLRLKPT